MDDFGVFDERRLTITCIVFAPVERNLDGQSIWRTLKVDASIVPAFGVGDDRDTVQCVAIHLEVWVYNVFEAFRLVIREAEEHELCAFFLGHVIHCERV